MKLVQLWSFVGETIPQIAGYDLGQALSTLIRQNLNHFINFRWSVSHTCVDYIKSQEGWSRFRKLSTVASAKRSRLIALILPETVSTQKWAIVMAVSKSAWLNQTSLRESITNLLYNRNHNASQYAIYSVSGDVQFIAFSFSAHQSHCTEIVFYPGPCPHTHFLHYLLVCRTIAEQKLQWTAHCPAKWNENFVLKRY